MRILSFLSVAIAASLFAAPLLAEDTSAPGYKDSIRCAVINTVFSGTEEDENSDAAKEYERFGTAWLVHALLTGGKVEDVVTGEFDEALRLLMAKMEDDSTSEDFLNPHAIKCAELEVAHADLLATYADD